MSDLNNAIRILRTSAPGPFTTLVQHVEELERIADETLVSAIQEELMRQNQGKVQVLRDLLNNLKS